MMRTYRLVAESVEERDGTTRTLPTRGVCIDVVLRGDDAEAIKRVGDRVHAWLNVGPFVGAFVDDGTDRNEAVTLA